MSEVVKRKRGRPRKDVAAATPKAKKLPSRANPRLRGAELLEARSTMAKIVEFWEKEGYKINAWVEELSDQPGRWEVKTDLVNGMPRGFRKPTRAPVETRCGGGGVTPIFRYRDIVRDGLLR